MEIPIKQYALVSLPWKAIFHSILASSLPLTMDARHAMHRRALAGLSLVSTDAESAMLYRPSFMLTWKCLSPRSGRTWQGFCPVMLN